jgi:lysine decarboxylase
VTAPADDHARSIAADPDGDLPAVDRDVPDPQDASPYADAVRRYAGQPWQRLTVPGHQAIPHHNPALTRMFGGHLLALDVAPLVPAVDMPPLVRPRDAIDLRAGDEAPGPGARRDEGDSSDDSAGVPGIVPMRQARTLAAQAWGAADTWFLTNGASQGNLAACLALRRLGGSAVVQRNVHSSVVDGLALSGLDAEFLTPGADLHLGIAHGLTPAQLDDALRRRPHAIAGYVVSPSYFGAQSDVAGLAEVAHAHDVPLVVDEAWGAHFGFHPDLPLNAVRSGADLVISSTHKLAGSLTQSAMLQLGHGRYAERLTEPVERALAMLTSTSASAILLASLDLARRDLAVRGREWIARSLDDAERVRSRIRSLGRFRDPDVALRAHPDVIALDPLRIVVDTRSGGIGGHLARALLFSRDRVHVEMSTDAVIVAVVGAGNGTDADRFVEALHALPSTPAAVGRTGGLPPTGPRAMGIRAASFAAGELVAAADAVGRVSCDALAAYPPGIPNVLPGEILTEAVLSFLTETAKAPYGHVRGAADPELRTVRVVAGTSAIAPNRAR